jgi:hypothetical protein
MTELTDTRLAGASRRRLIIDGVLAVGAAGFLGVSMAGRPVAAAQAKLPQKEIGYQNTPKGGQRCDGCANWLPPAACKMVAGPINAAGWCGLFVRKP